MKKTKSNKQAIEDLTAAVLVNTLFLAAQSKDILKDKKQNKAVVNSVLAMWHEMQGVVSS